MLKIHPKRAIYFFRGVYVSSKKEWEKGIEAGKMQTNSPGFKATVHYYNPKGYRKKMDDSVIHIKSKADGSIEVSGSLGNFEPYPVHPQSNFLVENMRYHDKLEVDGNFKGKPLSLGIGTAVDTSIVAKGNTEILVEKAIDSTIEAKSPNSLIWINKAENLLLNNHWECPPKDDNSKGYGTIIIQKGLDTCDTSLYTGTIATSPRMVLGVFHH